MGRVKEPQPVLLFTGIITQSSFKDDVIQILKRNFGEIVIETPFLSFVHTSYYEKEMGKSLLRKWVGFNKLINPSEIVDIKLFTNDIERQYSVEGKRVFNLDPGYISLQNMVLVTTKSYSHRICLDKGIYGEVTLMYGKQTGFMPLEWTYPDYRQALAIDFFNRARKLLKYFLKKENAHVEINE